MPRRQRAAILPTNIALLQNLVKRDPQSYKEEFDQQYSHYESLRDIFLLSPEAVDEGEEFGELIGFVSSVCMSFPEQAANFPQELATLLEKKHAELSPELRQKIIQCLVMLRNKGVITPEFLLHSLFPLLFAYSPNTDSPEEHTGYHAKELRRQIYSALISMLKSCNTGAKNQKLNRATQAMLFNLLAQRDSNGLWATKLTRELWRRGIWDDSRSVEIMTQACLHPDTKVVISGVRFFLGADKERAATLAEEEDSDDDTVDPNSLKHKMKVNKKNSRKQKKMDAVIHQINKKMSNKQKGPALLNFSAIQLLRDPQQFAQQMFETHLSGKNSRKFTMDQRIGIMSMVSRLVGMHKLSVLGLYSYFLKYLNPKQKNVTHILAAAAQASHDLVPPETINMVVRKIADEFVSDGVASEVAAAGINSIREILARNPAGIDKDLLQDLTAYKGSKAKSVMMASRSLISLYRDVAPEMLARKDRGKVGSIALIRDGENGALPKFGVERDVTQGIPGLERLVEWKKENEGGEDGAEDGWEQPEETGEDYGAEIEGDWVDVNQDSDSDIEINTEDEEDDKLNQMLPREKKGIKKKYLKYMAKNKERMKRKRQAEKDEEESDLELSDTEEKQPLNKKQKLAEEKKKQQLAREKALQEVLGSKVMTPADFEKLKELNVQAGVERLTGLNQVNEEAVDSDSLLGYEKHKNTKEERLKSVMEGREDRGKFGSAKGKIERPHSSTNSQKKGKKNVMMMIHNRSVQGKRKMSLRAKQKVLRSHIERQKKGK